jgi:uncharacterized membrane protein YgcG
MTRRTWLAGAAATAIGVLAWPGPAASADTSLGGYTADAQAAVVHLELYEPVIPIPSEPQGDFSLGYTHSQVSSGPSTRATASYLWPGVVIGDGFDQITKKPGATYPIQANSRFPATSDAPEKNTVQVTDGNGMTTSTDGYDTKAHVAGLGIAGPDTDLLGGLGSGLDKLKGKSSTTKPKTPPKVPVPVSGTLASVLTADNMTSTTEVVVGDNSVKTTATAAASSISILHGLLGIDGLSVTTSITSDGTKATSTGTVHIGALTVAGMDLGLGDKGALVGKDKAVKLPALPASARAALTQLGVTLDVTPVARKVDGATGTYDAQALVITIDTATLKDALNGPLNAIVTLLGPKMKTQLAPLLLLKPKLVINIGDVVATTSASPAYVVPPSGGGTQPPTTGGTIPGTAGGAAGGTGGGFTGGSSGGGFAGGGTTGGGTSAGNVPGGSSPSQTTPVAQTGLSLPPLGTVPKVLILGGLVLAAALGWVLQTAGGALLGGAGPCAFGLSKGIPDLRKG